MDLRQLRQEIDLAIETSLRRGDFGAKNQLWEACAYALRSPGKRWRAVMARCLGAPLDAALAVECVHTASLVVDDMPAFDNDTERRRMPTVHVVFGETIAQLASVCLVAAAFRLLTNAVRESTLPDAERRGMLLVGRFADNLGASGAAGGQFLDSWPCRATTEEELRHELRTAPPTPYAMQRLIHQKTATFFDMALVTGWLLGGHPVESVDQVSASAADFGLAFQVADDFCDRARDWARATQTGMPLTNYVLQFGEPAAKDTFLRSARNFAERMQALRALRAPFLEMLLWLIDRVMGATAPTGLPAASGASDPKT